MSFQPTVTGQQMPAREPDLRIFFHGLLLLRGLDGKFCYVETHRQSPRHVLSIETRTKTPQKPDVVHMRHFGQFASTDPDMTITITPPSSSPVVYKFLPSPFFDPELPIGQDNDFRWIINLEALHGKQLDIDTTKTRPGIIIGGGVYYFYTAQRMVETIRLKQNGTIKKSLKAVASIIGANLYLDNADQQIVMTWRGNGQLNTLRLNKPQAPVSHEIYINNSPLYEDPLLGISHSELAEYYSVISNVTEGEQFELEYPAQLLDSTSRAKLVESQGGSAKFTSLFGSPSIPCQSVVLDL